MKKTLSLLLAILLAASLLTACGQEESPAARNPQTPQVTLTQDALLGTWHLDWDMTDAEMLGAALNGSGLPQEAVESILADGDIRLSMDLRFAADGTVACVIDKDSFIQMYDTFADRMIDYILDGGIEKIVEAQGMTMEEYQAQLAAQNMTLEDVLTQFDTTYRQIFNGQTIYNSLRASADGDVSTTDDNTDRFDEAGNIVCAQPYTLSSNALTFHVGSDGYFFSSDLDTDLVAEYHFDGKAVTFTDANDTLVYNQSMTKIG